MVDRMPVPNWHPGKVGYVHHGELIEFPRECDAMTLPELIAHYTRIAAGLDAARLAHIATAAVIGHTLAELRKAYMSVRFTYGRTGMRWLEPRPQAATSRGLAS